MFLIKKLVASLLLPPASLALLTLLGLWLSRRHPRFGGMAIGTAALLLLLLSQPWVAHRLATSLDIPPPVTGEQMAQAQAIVILGGGIYRQAPEFGDDDTVSGSSLERLRYGALLARQSGLPVLVTGGAPFGGQPEAFVMKKVLESEYRQSVRWTETASRDTAENAANSYAILHQAGIVRIVLVTHAFHMRRAELQFRRQGLDVIPAPLGYNTAPALPETLLPSAAALEVSSRVLREWLGILAAG